MEEIHGYEEQHPEDGCYERNQFGIDGPNAAISDDVENYEMGEAGNYEFTINYYKTEEAYLELYPLTEENSRLESNENSSIHIEAEDSLESILAPMKFNAPTGKEAEKESDTIYQKGSTNTSFDMQKYSLEGTTQGSASLEASEKRLKGDVGPQTEETHDVASDLPLKFSLGTTSPTASEIDKKFKSEMAERNIIEVKTCGSDTIQKFEGVPQPLGFIREFVSDSEGSNYTNYSQPKLNKFLIEPSQLGESGELITGTGERNRQVDPSHVLTKEENESYILNLDGIKDDQEYRQWLTKTEKCAHSVEYLKAELGVPIQQALAEIVRIRPKDPIHYLGHWLFKWRHNQISHQKEMQAINELVYIRGLQPTRKKEYFKARKKYNTYFH